MKKLLKMLGMMALVTMMALGSTGTYAADMQAANGARAFICGNCGEAMNGGYIVYGSWKYTGGERACTHGHTGAKDQEKKRTNKVYAKCGACGYRMFKTYRDQYGWDCMG